MKLIIHFLLLSSLLILIEADDYLDGIRDVIRITIKETNGTIPNGVKLHVDGELREEQYSLVWKGDYKGQTLAIKLIKEKVFYENEMCTLARLDAVGNPVVENHGIPNVYVNDGSMLYLYCGIGMTLLEENLKNRWIKQKKSISELSILLIFKQGVKILEYLKKKKILHNDIKPSSIFFRGSQVFFGDWYMSCADGLDRSGYTHPFTSSGYYLNVKTTPMDDLESLVFSLWFVAGIIECDKVSCFSKLRQRKAVGEILAECKKNGTAESMMTQKCMKFKNKHVQEAFKIIAAKEMLEKKHAPDYKMMIDILDEAIARIYGGESGTPQFEWLTGQSSRAV